MADGISVERNKGISDIDLAIFKPKKIAKEFVGGSFANTYLLTDGTVRKYMAKTPNNTRHVDSLKKQYEDMKKLRYITKDLVPEIFGSRENSSDFYYDLEYLDGYDNLCSFDNATQNDVLGMVTKRLFSDVYCCNRPVASPEAWISEYLENRVFTKLPNNDPVEINGIVYEPLKKTLLDLAPYFVPKFESQIHGDLTLENIMWNPCTRDVKLIDCAGSYYVDNIYLDIGKIFQTMVGGYSTWNGDVEVIGDHKYKVVVPESLPIDNKWLDLWGPNAYQFGIYYMVTHIIRLIPYIKQKSIGHALQAGLLAHIFINKIDIKHMDSI
jgi:hypothetical protein